MNGSVSAVPGRRPARASTNVACASPGVSAAVAASRPATTGGGGALVEPHLFRRRADVDRAVAPGHEIHVRAPHDVAQCARRRPQVQQLSAHRANRRRQRPIGRQRGRPGAAGQHDVRRREVALPCCARSRPGHRRRVRSRRDRRQVAPAARAAEAAAAVNAGTFTMACEGIRSAPTAWALSDGSMTRARGPSIHSEATPRSASMVADCVSRSTSASPTAISSVPGCRNSTARPARWVTSSQEVVVRSPRDRRPSVRRPSEWWPSITRREDAGRRLRRPGARLPHVGDQYGGRARPVRRRCWRRPRRRPRR